MQDVSKILSRVAFILRFYSKSVKRFTSVIEADVRRRVACRGRLSVQMPVPGTTSGGELQPCIVAVKTHDSTSCWTRVVTAQST